MKKTAAHLGQHFLKNAHYAKVLAGAAHLGAEETVVEVGPGTGVLTRELLATGAHVVAIEKDTSLVAQLHETFAQEIRNGQLEIVASDVRDFSPDTICEEMRGLAESDAVQGAQAKWTEPYCAYGDGHFVKRNDEMRRFCKPYAVAANIPYYITGEIIRQFLTSPHQPRTMALLVQKEVAERIVARDGKESILSLSVKVYGTPRIVAKVSRGNFSPPPSVDSAILVIENVSRNSFADISEEHFFHIVRAGFASKRKFLLNNLSVIFGKEKVREAFAHIGIDEKVRAEDVSLTQWKVLAHVL